MRAEEGTTPHFLAHPIEKVADVTLPVRVDRSWILVPENVVPHHHRQELIHVLCAMRNILKVTRPLVPSRTLAVQRKLNDPVPGSVAGATKRVYVARIHANKLVE